MDITTNRQQPLPHAGKLRLSNDDGLARVVDSNGRRARLRPEAGTPVHGVIATGTLTGTTIAADDTVTIADLTYTFVDALSEDTGDAVPYEVLVGATDSDSLDNLIAAINGDTGEGTLYGTGTVAHPSVTAAAGAGDTMDVSFTAGAGVAGNDIATTATLTSGDWGAANLEGGVDATEGILGDQLFDSTNLYQCLADVTKTSTSGWKKIAFSAL